MAPNSSLKATFTPWVITMNSYVTVNKYVAVEYGWTCIGYQGIQGTDTYNVKDYRDQF